MNNESKREVGKRIKNIRLMLGETAEEFGKRFNPVANRGLVSGWENGRYLPNPERLEIIAEAGNVTVKFLLDGSPMDSFSIKIEELAQSMTKEEKFLHARQMITTFSEMNDMLSESMKKKNLPEKNIEVALNYNKAMTNTYFNTLFTPEELKEWENIFKPNENNN